MRKFAAVTTLLFTVGCGSDTEMPPISRAGIGLPLTPRQLAEVEQQGPVRFRRLWAGAGINSYAASVSPDGTFVTDIDWDTGDLAILRFSTSELERVTDKGTWSESSDFAEWSAVAPDGERIAYAWVNADVEGYELRTINLDGSGERVLAEPNEGIGCYAPRDWSDDGRWILAGICSSDRSVQIALISADDGTVRVVKELGWTSWASLSMSPDGRHVAYDFPPDAETVARDVYVVGVDGSGEFPLVQGDANDLLLGWTPDGSGLMYYSDRTIWRKMCGTSWRWGSPEIVTSLA
jgi:Tol biopolymer transport system component